MIVLIHGLGCDSGDFNDLLNLMDTSFATHSFQMPKDRGSRLGAGEGHFPGAVRGLAKKLRGENEIHLVAHSVGSAIALPVAVALDDSIKSMTLLEANLLGDDCRFLSRSLSACTTEQEVRDFICSLQDSDDEYVRRWTLQALEYEPLLLSEYASELVSTSESEELFESFVRLDAKKVYVYSDEYIGREVTNRTDASQLIHIPNSGHFLPVQCAKECSRIVTEMNRNTL